MKIAIVTDSNSGIKQSEITDSDIFVVPMPFIVGDEEYYEDKTLSQDKFYELLSNNITVFTSQPSIFDIKEMWDNLLVDYTHIIYIPMSSGLSGSCATAMKYAEEEYQGRVYVVDNQRISLTLKHSVYEAEFMAKKGFSPEEIVDYLVKTKLDASIYIMVPDLKYLKKGGRITATAAALGSFLNIKPVLQIQGGKLDSYTKVLSIKQANIKMIQAVQKDLETRFKDYLSNGEMRIDVAYTYNKDNALEFKKQVEQVFPQMDIQFVDPLSLSVSCHIGPNALAIACTRVTQK